MRSAERFGSDPPNSCRRGYIACGTRVAFDLIRGQCLASNFADRVSSSGFEIAPFHRDFPVCAMLMNVNLSKIIWCTSLHQLFYGFALHLA